MKNVSVWLIIPQTNLHVGSESSVNFSVIDKTIQRDVTTGLPCINSGSLKGAIKEYMSVNPENLKFSSEDLKNIFGSIKSDSSDVRKGGTLFFDASLLFIPKQCSNGKTYELVYADGILNDFSKKVNCLIGEGKLDSETLKQKVVSVFGRNNVSEHGVSEDDFKDMCSDDSLPIITRNCLENGQSTNLWYEQVLPSLSVLATFIVTKKEGQLDCLNNKIIQIGANATIGYGYCRFVKI